MADEENITIREFMGTLREEVHALKDAVEGLTVAIRGNGPDKGLIRHMDSIQESQSAIVRKIELFEQKGTPASQMELRSLRDKDSSQDVLITRLEGRMDRMDDRSETRRWQILVLFVTTVVAILISAGGFVLHFLQPK